LFQSQLISCKLFYLKRSPHVTHNPPTVLSGNGDRFNRGSTTNEKFHQADENSGGYDSRKTYRQPVKKIQYNKEGLKGIFFIHLKTTTKQKSNVVSVPDKKNENFGDNFSVVKTFKGGYSSDDKVNILLDIMGDTMFCHMPVCHMPICHS